MCPDCTLSWTAHAYAQIPSRPLVCAESWRNEEQIPSCSTTVPLHTRRPVLSAQPPPGTQLPPALFLQGIRLIRLAEGFVALQQQIFLLQPTQLSDILGPAGFHPREQLSCVLAECLTHVHMYTCTYGHTSIHTYINSSKLSSTGY